MANYATDDLTSSERMYRRIAMLQDYANIVAGVERILSDDVYRGYELIADVRDCAGGMAELRFTVSLRLDIS